MLNEIEITLEKAKEKVALAEMLNSLIALPAFKTIITEGYFEREPIRLSRLSTVPSMLTAENEKILYTRIQAIGYLNQYFVSIMKEAEMAKRAIEVGNEELEELRNEVV